MLTFFRRWVTVLCLILFTVAGTPAPLVAQIGTPTLDSPANGSQDQPTTLMLRWNEVFGATRYQLQLADEPTFGTPVVDESSITSTEFQAGPLTQGTTYHWRVRAFGLLGTGNWSDVWTFTTTPPLPAAPVLLSPPDGATGQPTSLSLQWSATEHASVYRIQVSRDIDFTNLVLDDPSVSTTSRTVGGLSNGITYYWRVSGSNGVTAGTGPWSNTWTFTTASVTPTTAPVLVSPPNNSTNQPLPVTFTWTDVGGATSYNLEVSINSSFTTTAFSDTTIVGTSHEVGSLQNNATYFWRVRAKNGSGWGNYSPIWNLTTRAANAPGATTDPATQITATSAQLNATINPNGLSTTVKFNYDTDTSLQNAVTAEESPVNGTEPVQATNRLQGLQPNTTYYFSVFATSSAGSSVGATRTFKTAGALASPVPVSPPDGSINQPTTVTFRWTKPLSAITYHLQVSAGSSFTTLMFNDSTLADTTQQVGSLARSSTYFWRVRARNSMGYSGWSSIGSFSTIPPAPEPPLLASPSNGVSEQPTTVSLTWNPSASATSYRLQVSTSSSFTTTIFDQEGITSTSQTVGGLANNTTHFWRVRALNAGGASDWSTVWRFTTNVSAPATPTLVSPSNGSVNQPTTPTLTWNPVSSADTYRLQVSTSSSFATMLIEDSTITSTSREVGPLSQGTTYSWRVSARNSAGSSTFSSTRTFTTVPPPPDQPILASPADGATYQPTTLTLSWNAVSGAQTYRLQVSTSASFASTIVDDSTLSGTSMQVGALATNTQYYWRVRAKNAGGTGPSSNTWSFITTEAAPSPPAAPVLSSPSNGATGVPQSPTLSWSASAGATSYQLQVSGTSDFGSLVTDRSGLSSTSSMVEGLAENTTYHWRVRAYNAGGAGDWSTAWSFTTDLSAPSAPMLTAPTHGSVDVPTDPVLSWSTSAEAWTYRLQVSTTTSFVSTVFDDPTLSTSSKQIGPLANNTTYYWRVNATNSGGTGPWSNISRFTTTPPPPPPPSQASPENGSPRQPTVVTLEWSPIAGAKSYDLVVSKTTTYNTMEVSDTSLMEPSRQVGPLANNTTYYWRVRAKNGGGSSSWSPSWNFTTEPQSQSGPTLTSPENGAISQPTSVLLRWNGESGANSYHVQVSTTSSFTSTIFNDGAVTGTSQQIGPLTNGVTYYWRVRSNFLLVTGDWSNVWSFTTVPLSPSTPTLLSPPNASSGEPTTLTLEWSPVGGASSYHLQVSISNTFGTTLVNDSSLTGSSRRVGPLAGNTLYYWRVRSKNPGGASSWSPTWNFRTMSAAPAAPVLTSPLNNATDRPTTLTVQWSSISEAVAYHLQLDTSATLGAPPIDDTTLTTGSNQIGPLTPSTRYYWRVRAKTGAGWGPFSSIWNFSTTSGATQTVTLSTTVEFPAHAAATEFQAHEYRIVGIPGASNQDVRTLLPGDPEKDWMVFWDNGRATDYLVRYDGSVNFRHSTGRAFWVIKKGPWTINTTVPVAPVNASGETEIALHPGWNLITNPLPTAVSWSTVMNLNGVAEPIHTFDGSFAPSSQLEPYKGYYFFNETGLLSLRVPGAGSVSGRKDVTAGTTREESSGWNVSVMVSTPSVTDHSLWFGVAADALPGKDHHDHYKPRGVGSSPGTYFDRPEWNPDYHTFGADIRPMVAECERWPFQVTAPSFEMIEMKFDGIDRIPAEFDVYLIDMIRGVAVDLRKNWSYKFQSVQSPESFTILVGTPQSVEKQRQSVLSPHTFSLGNNYPNPFNPETVIPVELPYSSEVTLAVYSIMGREVAVLHRGRLEPGRHWFRWNGRDGEGATVSSGVYFYRFTTPGGATAVRRMMLLK
ncbi:MAG: fibronectin type III domain-containing protein [Ignavibacteriales bacterium]|nr:fibronectin type III domain-containing protein [Ignavibacteriales bacterium]